MVILFSLSLEGCGDNFSGRKIMLIINIHALVQWKPARCLEIVYILFIFLYAAFHFTTDPKKSFGNMLT